MIYFCSANSGIVVWEMCALTLNKHDLIGVIRARQDTKNQFRRSRSNTQRHLQGSVKTN